ncbi:MAG: AAA family ATPase [Gammaproteobacteria bacterium WSBS_2016_MAG_OTU1]
MPPKNDIATPSFSSVTATIDLLSAGGYLPSKSLAIAVFLAATMRRPLLLEGEPGVGKTAVAIALAKALSKPLLRLQCYEGIDAAAAVYDWDYPRQLLAAKLRPDSSPSDLYSEEFLLRRPLLQSLQTTPSPILLIDEIDRADEPFEAFLLEFLAEWQISIPEFGVIRADEPPLTILTSNRTREIHDALRRRCLYCWVDFPAATREINIIRLHHPHLDDSLTAQIVTFVRRLRTLDLYKLPGIAETVDWAHAITKMDTTSLSEEAVDETLGALLKHQDDIERTRQHGVGNLLNADE